MSKINEIIVSTVFPIVKAVGKAEMKEVLSGIKLHNTQEVYYMTLHGIYSDFCLLKEMAVKTKTMVDDGIVDLVLEAVQETAAAEGILLI